ncbi:MAG: monovalent cation/H(+) antiporter subunit G [Hyphomicrobiales bacterium]|nr:monovalent cation/H(+) antiporter subunit G [Hyphomicrobiales bacterium]
MTDLLSLIIGGAFLLAGSFFLLVGALGLLRMPDLFTRMQAASVGETLGGSLLLIGMMIHGGFSLVTFKLVVLFAVIVFFGPVATHALARAARYAGIEPQLSTPPAGRPVGAPSAETAAKATKATKATKASKKARLTPAKARRKPAKKKARK